MIDLYALTSPNVQKIYIMLEETKLPYKEHFVDVWKGEQYNPDFIKINPNSKIPTIVDHEGPGGKPYAVFESGAILLYLAEKSGRLLPHDVRGRVAVTQWLFWQVAGLGPMAGQNHHFVRYAPEKIPYAIERYVKETDRLYGVLNKRLADRAFLAGDYSIADIATYPWIVPHEAQRQNLEDFPHLKRWFQAIHDRPATLRAYEKAASVNTQSTITEKAKRVLFAQTARP
jgi:GST-like protein